MLRDKPKLKKNENENRESGVVKLDFPVVKFLIDDLIKLFADATKLDCTLMRKVCFQQMGMIEQIRIDMQKDIKGSHPIIAYQLSSKTMCKPNSDLSIEETLKMLDTLKLNSNEFYTIFDTAQGEHVVVDERIREILGLEPSVFNMRSMLGHDPENPLFHPDDIYHSIRFGTLAYFVLAIPNFEFKALQDFYCAKFRISTMSSKIEEVRKAGYVTLEKKSYLTEERKKDSQLAMRILYRWSVYYQDSFEHTLPYFATDPVRTSFMLNFWYLYNAQLMGLSTKFLLMLDARSRHDRNKAVAMEINGFTKEFCGSEGTIDEGQVADCFAKTIRPRVAEAVNTLEKRLKPLVIHSDIEAVYYATRLGLLPIPARIKELIYRNITEI